MNTNEHVNETHQHDEAVHARHARIKVAQASKSIDDLRDHWPENANVLEYALLRRRFEAEERPKDE